MSINIIKNYFCRSQENRVWSLDREDPLEKGMEIYCTILAWRIPWTEESGRLQSSRSQRVGHNWICTHLHSTSNIFGTHFTPKHICMSVIIEIHTTTTCPVSNTGHRFSLPPSWNPSFLWLLEEHLPSTLLVPPYLPGLQMLTWAQSLDGLLLFPGYTPLRDVFFWFCGFKHHSTSKTPKLMSPVWTCPNSKHIHLNTLQSPWISNRERANKMKLLISLLLGHQICSCHHLCHLSKWKIHSSSCSSPRSSSPSMSPLSLHPTFNPRQILSVILSKYA